MGKPYSLDLRERVCRHIAAGNFCRSAGRIFSISAATAIRFAAQQRERGDVLPKPQGRSAGQFGKLAQHANFLNEIVEAEPDITLQELSNALRDTFVLNVHLSSIHRALDRAGFSYKKGLIATERNRPALQKARREWIMHRQPHLRQAPHRLVFIDETAVKTNFTRLRGRAQVGDRVYGTTPFGRWYTQTFIAGLTQNTLVAPWVIKGAMNGSAFDPYIETQLAPILEPGTLVILDNLSTHKSHHAAQILKKHGCWFLFLPPYSPDLNPIELAFSKLKAHLRRIGARTFEELITALGDICDLYKPEECSNYLKATGYASD